MIDVKNLNIWRPEENEKKKDTTYLQFEIDELNLSVRSYNCLKRAGCNTVKDIVDQIGEDGQGLKRIRNLGIRSEREILDAIQALEKLYENLPGEKKKEETTLIKPARKMGNRYIEEFHLSQYALNKLQESGIKQIKDLYETDPKNEPGWYAVRELFEKIPYYR